MNKSSSMHTPSAPPLPSSTTTSTKTPRSYLPIIVMILFLTAGLFYILFGHYFYTQVSKSEEQTIADICIVLFFSLLVFSICIALIPNFKDMRHLFEQISNVTYVIIYTIALILFFTLAPSNIINQYAYLILPVAALLGLGVFGASMSHNYIKDYNIGYERIKVVILLFCLITIFTVFYNINPGGYIQEYFGYSLLLTIIIAVFAFLYLMIVMTLPNFADKKTGDAAFKKTAFLANFSSLSVYGSLGLLLFAIIMTIGIATYPGGFFNNVVTSSMALILVLLIGILWAIMLISGLTPDAGISKTSADRVLGFKSALLVVFGIIIAALSIYWLLYNIPELYSTSGIISFVLNLVLALTIIYLMYSALHVSPKPKPAAASSTASTTSTTSTTSNIAHMVRKIWDVIRGFASEQYQSTTTSSILVLILTCICFLVYFKTPSLFNTVNLQGGTQLINQPVDTNTERTLNIHNDTIDYTYAISCWIFIDAAPPNTNPSYAKYTSLLNYGGKPNILYNAQKNTLRVTMSDEIMYQLEHPPLQKWNNFIINYDGGVLDVFLNGVLVKSNIGVVPYYTFENLTTGEDGGVHGGICNVVYFNHALTSNNVYYLYNMVKDNPDKDLNRVLT